MNPVTETTQKDLVDIILSEIIRQRITIPYNLTYMLTRLNKNRLNKKLD